MMKIVAGPEGYYTKGSRPPGNRRWIGNDNAARGLGGPASTGERGVHQLIAGVAVENIEAIDGALQDRRRTNHRGARIRPAGGTVLPEMRVHAADAGFRAGGGAPLRS